MFSGALKRALRHGISGGPDYLSFLDVRNLTRSILEEQFGKEFAILPVLYELDQEHRILEEAPFFPNPGWGPPRLVGERSEVSEPERETTIIAETRTDTNADTLLVSGTEVTKGRSEVIRPIRQSLAASALLSSIASLLYIGIGSQVLFYSDFIDFYAIALTIAGLLIFCLTVIDYFVTIPRSTAATSVLLAGIILSFVVYEAYSVHFDMSAFPDLLLVTAIIFISIVILGCNVYRLIPKTKTSSGKQGSYQTGIK
jgi:hypothetical protein